MMERERAEMVESQIIARGIKDPGVILAMQRAPRHIFVPEDQRLSAYEDRPLPIGFGQTISQPYIVALMTQSLEIKPGHKVLEIGTGCGYQTAVLTEMGAEVYSIERVESLYELAEKNLADSGYSDIHLRWDDGGTGWPEPIIFDSIMLTCAVKEFPEYLWNQLASKGRMVLPLEENSSQTLMLYQKSEKKEIKPRLLCYVRFVPFRSGIEKTSKKT